MSRESSDSSSSSSDTEVENDLKAFVREADKAMAELKTHAPEDATSEYVKEYFAKSLWEGKGDEPQTKEEDDLEEVIRSSKWEEDFNFRFEEAGADKIQSHPRRVEGENREEMSSRKKKRMKEKEEKNALNEEREKLLDEIDEKYHQIYIKNGNKLTNEELSAWNAETAAVYVKAQDSPFPYMEVKADGDIAKSIKILEEKDDESESEEDLPEEGDDEDIDEEVKKQIDAEFPDDGSAPKPSEKKFEKKKFDKKKFDHALKDRRDRGHSRHGRGFRGGKHGRGGNSRENSYHSYKQ